MRQEDQGPYCQELADLIASCDPENPDPDLLSNIDRHVIECEICQMAESALDNTVRVYRDLEPHGVSAEFEVSLVNQLCRSNGRTDQE
jgi:hypothetical protein